MSNLLRSKYIQFRASEPEALTLNRLSNQIGLTLSETMRLLIREAAASHGLPDVGMAELVEMISSAPVKSST